ncbi:MAG: FHA domain-containing protein [Lachnospiraceae bacterium]|nr:FHA domain-containing protein [Lachnospiraceae bacterium]
MIIVENNKAREYQLENYKKDILGFGRQLDCDIVMSSSYVSRLHGCIYRENGSWFIKDLESTYGLFYNGNKIVDMKLNGGEHIKINSSNGEYVEFIFQPDEIIKNQAEFNNETYGNMSDYSKINIKNKKKKILLISIIFLLVIALVATVFILFNKKDYKKLARQKTKESVKSLMTGDYRDEIKGFTKYDYSEIYDYLSQKDYYEDLKDSDDFKKYLKEEMEDEEDYEDEYELYDIEETSTGFVFKEDDEDDYYYELNVNVGEAEKISKVNREDLWNNLCEIGGVEEDIFDYLVSVIEKSDCIYKVPVKISFTEIYEGEKDSEEHSIYDLVYVKNKKCISLISRIGVLERLSYYGYKSSKSEDVSAGKSIKTAVEIILSNEGIYAYLTDTDGLGYIYFTPNGTDNDDIRLDVNYQHNYDDYIGSRDVVSDIKDNLMINLDNKIPDMKCKQSLDDSIGKPVCYVASVDYKGDVKVFSSTVESGFYCDYDGNTYLGYQLCPEIDGYYQ